MADFNSLIRPKVEGCWLLLFLLLAVFAGFLISVGIGCTWEAWSWENWAVWSLSTVFLVTLSNPKEIRGFTLKGKKKGGGFYLYSLKTLIIWLHRFSSSDVNVKNTICHNMVKLLFSLISASLLSFLCYKLQAKCFGHPLFWNLVVSVYFHSTLPFFLHYWVFNSLAYCLCLQEKFQFSDYS